MHEKNQSSFDLTFIAFVVILLVNRILIGFHNDAYSA